MPQGRKRPKITQFSHNFFEAPEATTVTPPDANRILALAIAPYPVGGGPITPTEADVLPNLEAGDFGPSAEPQTEEVQLANGGRMVLRNGVAYPVKEGILRVSSGHPKVQQLWDHSAANELARYPGRFMGYNQWNRDGSAWRGAVEIANMGLPTDGAHRVTFSFNYITRLFVPVSDNPPPVANTAPTATALNPTTGAAGTDVTVTGTELDTVTEVRFIAPDGVTVAATVTVFLTQPADGLTLSFDAPAGLTVGTAYTVRVVNPNGTADAPQTYTGA